MSRTTLILLALTADWFTPLVVLAQPPPVYLRLKGIALGSDVSGLGTDVQVVGNFAYLAWIGGANHPGGLEILCVTNPFAPVRVGGYESDAQVNAVRVAGDYAYLASGSVRTFTNDPGAFEIINVSDSANPVRVGGLGTLGRANGLRVAGNYAYVPEATRWTGTNLLGALEIFDVRTPTNPIRVATFDTAGSATSVDVSGSHAYLADGLTDLQVIDLSEPGNPRLVGRYYSDVLHNQCGFEPGGPANFVQVVGNLAYSAGDNGLHVLDISDPAHPVSIGDNFCFPIQSLQVSGHNAYATIWHSLANSFSLLVINGDDPANLAAIGSQANWRSRVFSVVGNLIYLATNPLSVYEISDRPAINYISLAGETVTLAWDFAPGFLLQRAAALDNPVWSDVPGTARQSRIELSMTGGKGFFRLAKP